MTIHTLKRRPVTVKAVRFTGDNWAEIQTLTGPGHVRQIEPVQIPGDGTMVAEVYNVLHCQWVGVFAGQWIVRGLRGELYPIDPEVAQAGYEPPSGGWPA